jgi:transcriptional regulator with XRE-family HTH domain
MNDPTSRVVHLGLKIKIARITARMTIGEVARRTGIDKNSISRIERSEVCVRLDNFIALCTVLKAHPIELLCDSPVWNPEKVSL